MFDYFSQEGLMILLTCLSAAPTDTRCLESWERASATVPPSGWQSNKVRTGMLWGAATWHTLNIDHRTHWGAQGHIKGPCWVALFKKSIAVQSKPIYRCTVCQCCLTQCMCPRQWPGCPDPYLQSPASGGPHSHTHRRLDYSGPAEQTRHTSGVHPFITSLVSIRLNVSL